VKFEILKTIGISPQRSLLYLLPEGEDVVCAGEFVRSRSFRYRGWQFQYSTNRWPKMTNAENFEIRTAIREMVTVLNVTDRILK